MISGTEDNEWIRDKAAMYLVRENPLYGEEDITEYSPTFKSAMAASQLQDLVRGRTQRGMRSQ